MTSTEADNDLALRKDFEEWLHHRLHTGDVRVDSTFVIGVQDEPGGETKPTVTVSATFGLSGLGLEIMLRQLAAYRMADKVTTTEPATTRED